VLAQVERRHEASLIIVDGMRAVPPFGTPGVLDRQVGEGVLKDRSALTRSPDRVVARRTSYR
jgi:hypothetical protein